MNADRLLALYERISEAPDAVARLRRFVLDLAVRGKLVEQDPADEPASELLARIASEKARLVKAGEIKANKSKKIGISEKSTFSVPFSWTWTFLDEVAACLDFIRKPINSTERKKRIEGLSENALYPYYGATQQQGWIDSYIFDDDLVLLGEDGVAFFDPFRSKAYTVSGKTWVNNHAHVFKPILTSHKFLTHYLNVFDYSGRVVGATRAKLNQARALTIPIPLPPLAEQHRIVAKVDELMALCDRLEDARKTREETRDKFTAATLARLTAPEAPAASETDGTNPPTGATSNQAGPDNAAISYPSGTASEQTSDFRTRARFAIETLPALTSRPDQIKSLRQTILNLAVRGKLVEQDPADEPAAELLKRIAVERAHLINAGEIGKQKPVPALDEAKVPFELPDRWTWCRLGSLVLASDAGWSPRTENHAREGDAWGVLKVSAVSWDYFDPEANKQVLPRTEPRLQAQVHKGDFLISRANTAELVARAVLVLNEPRNLMMSDKIVRLRLATECDHRFAWLVNNNADYARDYYASNATGVSPSMKNVSRAVILNLPIPLPPLGEQRRIVAKVDTLMALCDQLEAALTSADTTRTRLLEALLHEALEPASETMEAAE